MMKRYASGLLIILITGMIGLVHAASPIEQTLTTDDYFTLFISAIIFVNVFLVMLYKILHRETRKKKKSSFWEIFGNGFGFLAIALGSVLIILDILVLATVGTGITGFVSAYYFLTYFIADIVYGIIITGGLGLLFFLIGIYVLVVIHGSLFIDKSGMPDVSGAVAKTGEDFDMEMPLNPTLNFQVITREGSIPAPDVKVILKQRDGTMFHSKFTDFNGFVKFEGVEGYSQEHYAYVEGDEDRLIFLIRQL